MIKIFIFKLRKYEKIKVRKLFNEFHMANLFFVFLL